MRYLSHVDKYLTLKYKYKYKYSGHKYKYNYKYFKMVLEYYSSTSTSTKYYISVNWVSVSPSLAQSAVLPRNGPRSMRNLHFFSMPHTNPLYTVSYTLL